MSNPIAKIVMVPLVVKQKNLTKSTFPRIKIIPDGESGDVLDVLKHGGTIQLPDKYGIIRTLVISSP